MKTPVLIVGAGPTASVLACSLARKISKQELNVTVWEKSRGVGGRMVWCAVVVNRLIRPPTLHRG